MRYINLVLALLWFLVISVVTLFSIVTSMATFPLWYWFMQDIRRIVYTHENKKLLGVDMSATEGASVRQWMLDKNLVAHYRPSKLTWLYFIAKPIWWLMKDDGFDAGAEGWAYSTFGSNGESPNGQLPIVSGCWRRIGEASDAYVVTDRLRHFIAVFRYTAMRNGAWNLRDYGTALGSTSGQGVLWNTGELPDDARITYDESLPTRGSKLVQFVGDGKPRFIYSGAWNVLSKVLVIKAGWQYNRSKRFTVTLQLHSK